jgi:hypothetical protein
MGIQRDESLRLLAVLEPSVISLTSDVSASPLAQQAHAVTS